MRDDESVHRARRRRTTKPAAIASGADNVRSALEWALHSTRDDDVLLAGRIAGSFRGLWLIPGSVHECRRWFTLLLERMDETQQPVVVANLLAALAQALAGSQMLAVYERLMMPSARHLMNANTADLDARRYIARGRESEPRRVYDRGTRSRFI